MLVSIIFMTGQRNGGTPSWPSDLVEPAGTTTVDVRPFVTAKFTVGKHPTREVVIVMETPPEAMVIVDEFGFVKDRSSL